MSVYERRVTRAALLKAGAAGAVGLTFARPAFGGLTQMEATTLNWLTWSDHYANDQLAAVAKKIGIRGRPTLRRPLRFRLG